MFRSLRELEGSQGHPPGFPALTLGISDLEQGSASFFCKWPEFLRRNSVNIWGFAVFHSYLILPWYQEAAIGNKQMGVTVFQ